MSRRGFALAALKEHTICDDEKVGGKEQKREKNVLLGQTQCELRCQAIFSPPLPSLVGNILRPYGRNFSLVKLSINYITQALGQPINKAEEKRSLEGVWTMLILKLKDKLSWLTKPDLQPSSF
jgi:hypothetical protein